MTTMKLVILDRDGTINEDSDDFVKCADEFVPIEGSVEAIARLCQAGWHVAVATNQSGLGRGLFDAAALNAMHAKLNRLLSDAGGRVDGFFFCPHAPDDDCDCRKPKPGLFDQIQARYGLDSLQGVPCVGDSLRDLQAGAVRGCMPHLVLTGKGQATATRGELPQGTQRHANLLAFAQALLDNPAP
jgi:D-glycero-D-manno-heptose 1,7-bisphosphate phosphatase